MTKDIFFLRKEMVAKLDWWAYGKIILFNSDDPTLKLREELESEGYACHWFTYEF